MTGRLFFVGIPQAHVRSSIERAQRLGLEVVLGDRAENLERHRDLVKGADRLVVTDYTAVETLLTTARDLDAERPLSAVVTFKDAGAVPTAVVAEKFGLPTNAPEAVAACIDKARTHQAFADAGFPRPRWAVCPNPAALHRFVAEVGPFVVVKPLDASGSLGVRVLGPGDDLAAAYAGCRAACPDSPVLAEEKLIGREVSIEAMIHHGRPVLFGVTQKVLFPGTVVEAGHFTPDPGTELTRAEYTDVVARAAAALDLTLGALHLEGFHTEAGFVPTEIHTRFGGDEIVAITEAAARCDMTTPVLAEVAGLAHEVTFGPSPGAAGVRFLVAEPGRVRAIDGVARAAAVPGVIRVAVPVRVGDPVRPLRSSYDRVGWVTAQGAGADEVVAALDQAVRCVQIRTA